MTLTYIFVQILSQNKTTEEDRKTYEKHSCFDVTALLAPGPHFARSLILSERNVKHFGIACVPCDWVELYTFSLYNHILFVWFSRTFVLTSCLHLLQVLPTSRFVWPNQKSDFFERLKRAEEKTLSMFLRCSHQDRTQIRSNKHTLKVSVSIINLGLSPRLVTVAYSGLPQNHHLIIKLIKKGSHLYEFEQRFTEHNIIRTINFPERSKDSN